MILSILEPFSDKDLSSVEMTSSYFRKLVDEGECWRKKTEFRKTNVLIKLNMVINNQKKIIEGIAIIIKQFIEMLEIYGPREETEVEIQMYRKFKRECQYFLSVIEAYKKKIEDALAAKMWKKALKMLVLINF